MKGKNLDKPLLVANQSLDSSDEENFRDLSKSATLIVIIEAKQRQDGSPQNLLTREHFAEMIRFDDWLHNLTIPSPPENSTSPDQVTTFYQMCIRENITSPKDEAEWAELCETDESYCVVPI